MVLDFNRVAAYICPFCSMISQHTVGIFDFSGNTPLELSCAEKNCNEPCVSIIPGNKKYRIEIECPICMEQHSFFVPENRLWKKNLITFQCPESGIDIFFFGKPDEVNAKVEENIMTYHDLFSEYENYAEQNPIYETIGFKIARRLSELLQQHALHCKCGSEKILVETTEDGMMTMCADCGHNSFLRFDEKTLKKLTEAKSFVLQ